MLSIHVRLKALQKVMPSFLVLFIGVDKLIVKILELIKDIIYLHLEIWFPGEGHLCFLPTANQICRLAPLSVAEEPHDCC